MEKNQVVGKLSFYLNGEQIGSYDIKAKNGVMKLGLSQALVKLLLEVINLK